MGWVSGGSRAARIASSNTFFRPLYKTEGRRENSSQVRGLERLADTIAVWIKWAEFTEAMCLKKNNGQKADLKTLLGEQITEEKLLTSRKVNWARKQFYENAICWLLKQSLWNVLLHFNENARREKWICKYKNRCIVQLSLVNSPVFLMKRMAHRFCNLLQFQASVNSAPE